MNAYPAGNPVTIVADYAAFNIYDPVISTQFRVVSQAGAELLPKAPVDPSETTDTGFTVVVPANLNLLQANAARELRIIDFYFETASGHYSRSTEYVIEADAVLIPGNNSFLSYGDAVMVGYEIPALTGWNNVDKSTRISAMLHTKRAIARLPYSDPDTCQSYPDLQAISLDEWGLLPFEFKQALGRAQVIESNEICGGDPVLDYRRRGIQSITVGESKNFFQAWKSSDSLIMSEMGISPSTKRELSPYLTKFTYRLNRS